jgi:hypothetical protein
MAYSLAWGPVVRHHSYWIPPGDIWSAYRSAHFIAWGDLGDVYSAGTGLVTFPGILLFLVPLALLTGRLGLSENFPYFVPHATAWLVLGPYEILISCSALFACDALAQRLGVGARNRLLLCVAEAVALWNVSVIWGHPEDALALTFALYALLFALDGRWTGAGWLFGAAVVTQPVVLLMAPVLLAMAGRGRVIPFLARSGIPSVVLLATPLIAEFHSTMRSIVEQPNFPNIDHRTPWTSLAPRIGGHGLGLAVSAGPGRLLAIAAACGLGVWARRWRDRPDLLVWAVAAALALRCATESVMDSYYVWPAIAVGLVVAATGSARRLLVAIAGVVAVTIVSDLRINEWVWWGLVTGGIIVVLAFGMSSRDWRCLPIDTYAPGLEPEGQDDPRPVVAAIP